MWLIKLAACGIFCAVIACGESALSKSCESGAPCTSIPSRSWTKLEALGAPEGTLGYEGFTYSGAMNCTAVLGDYHAVQSEDNRSIGCFSTAEQRWDVPFIWGYFHDGYMPEGGHPVGMLSWSDFYNFWYYLGGNSGSNQIEWTFHTFQIDGIGRTSRDVVTGNAANPKPLPGFGGTPLSAVVWDSSVLKYVIFPDNLGDLQTYDPVANLYTRPTTTGTAPSTALNSANAAYDYNTHQTYIFGGWTAGNACSATANTTIYVYNAATSTWSTATQNADTNVGAPNGGIPPARVWGGWAFDGVDNIFLLTGGCNSSTDLSDTWAWHPDTGNWEWINAASVYPVVAGGNDHPFWRLSYDRASGLFVFLKIGDGSTDYYGGTSSFQAGVYGFCYAECANAGTKSRSYGPPTGWLNSYTSTSSYTTQTNATDASIAAAGTTTYAAMIQTGTEYDIDSNQRTRHCYVFAGSGASWSQLGTSYCGEAIGNEVEHPSVAVVGSTPWIAFSDGAPPTTYSQIHAGSWNGSAWNPTAVGLRTAGTFQGSPKIFANGTTPMVAFIEGKPAGIGSAQTNDAYIDQYSSGWSALGGTLRRNSGGYIDAVSASSDGTKPYACHIENVDTDLRTVSVTPQVYCEYWSGSAWIAIGTSLNQTASDWANFVSSTYFGGHLYVAWTERSIGQTTSPCLTSAQCGNPVLYVAQCTTASCSVIGSGMNKNVVGGWALNPNLANDGTNLYLSFEEQAALNEPNHLYVDEWNGIAWSDLGGALNMDPTGSARYSAIAVVNSQPTVVWPESTPGNLSQAYAKQWNGTDWGQMESIVQLWHHGHFGKFRISGNKN